MSDCSETQILPCNALIGLAASRQNNQFARIRSRRLRAFGPGFIENRRLNFRCVMPDATATG
jgi:hypothetical protein